MENYKVKYYNYDVSDYAFIRMIEDLFSIDDLSQTHTFLKNDAPMELFTNENDDATHFHDLFYTKMNSGWEEFEKTYLSLIKHIATKILNQDSIIFQSKPNIRIQLPNNIAVGGSEKDEVGKYGWHRDSDDEYNHPPFEMNFIIPLTDSVETASIYIESYPNSNVFQSIKMKTGQFFQFRGGKLIHGNKPNKTEKTRVSLDFRLVLKKDYDERYCKNSKLSNKKFIIGEYYSKMEGI